MNHNFYKKSLSSLIISFLLSCFLMLNSIASEIQNGKASWIGESMQGKSTTSGDPFDVNSLTASHATLPLGEYVKVTSQKTGKSVIVKINNRMEINSGRVIDLSKRAAEQIGIIEEGIGLVSIENLPKNTTENTAKVEKVESEPELVQYGSFKDLKNAQDFQELLLKQNTSTIIKAIDQDGKIYYRVYGKEKEVNTEANNMNKTPFENDDNSKSLTFVNAGTTKTLKGFSASHNTLPLGEYVRIISKDTNKSAIVKITNRMKGGTGKAMDISEEVADQIGVKINQSNFLVNIEDLGNNINEISSVTVNTIDANSISIPTDIKSDSLYQIQYGSFTNIENARELQKMLAEKNIATVVETIKRDDKTFYKVLNQNNYNNVELAKCRVLLDSPEYGIITPSKKVEVEHSVKPKKEEKKTEKVEKKEEKKIEKNKKEEVDVYEYGIQYGAFKTSDYAKKLADKLLKTYNIKSIVYQFPDDENKLFRVLSDTPFNKKEEAESFIKSKSLQDNAVVLTFLK